MTYLQLAAHLFLLLFWARLWVKPADAFSFNPFLSGPTRLTDNVLGFLRPALPLPGRLTPLAALALFWTFQAMFFARFSREWTMTIGVMQFTPPEGALSWGTQFAYSGLYTAQFLILAWTVYFFTQLIARPGHENRAQEAFTFFTAPFSRLPLFLQPFVLLALHAALAVTVVRVGTLPNLVELVQEAGGKSLPPEVFAGASVLTHAKIICLALMSFTSGLQTLMYTLIFFLFGGLAAALFGAKTPMSVCRESADVLLGRFSRNPAATGGGFDFTPVLFIIAVSFISGQLQLVLIRLIQTPPPL